MLRVRVNNGILEVIYSETNLKQGDILTLEPVKETRTNQQNKYLWKIFEIIGNKFGYSKEDIKILLLLEPEINHVKETVSNKTGEVIKTPASTHNLSKAEFSELTEKIIRWAANWGVDIQSPQEFYEN